MNRPQNKLKKKKSSIQRKCSEDSTSLCIEARSMALQRTPPTANPERFSARSKNQSQQSKRLRTQSSQSRRQEQGHASDKFSKKTSNIKQKNANFPPPSRKTSKKKSISQSQELQSMNQRQKRFLSGQFKEINASVKIEQDPELKKKKTYQQQNKYELLRKQNQNFKNQLQKEKNQKRQLRLENEQLFKMFGSFRKKQSENQQKQQPVINQNQNGQGNKKITDQNLPKANFLGSEIDKMQLKMVLLRQQCQDKSYKNKLMNERINALQTICEDLVSKIKQHIPFQFKEELTRYEAYRQNVLGGTSSSAFSISDGVGEIFDGLTTINTTAIATGNLYLRNP